MLLAQPPSVPFLLFRSDKTTGADHGTVQVQHPSKDPSASSRLAGHEAPPQRDEERPGVPHHFRLQSPYGGTDSQTGQWESDRAWHQTLPGWTNLRAWLRLISYQICYDWKCDGFDLVVAWWEKSSSRRSVSGDAGSQSQLGALRGQSMWWRHSKWCVTFMFFVLTWTASIICLWPLSTFVNNNMRVFCTTADGQTWTPAHYSSK